MEMTGRATELLQAKVNEDIKEHPIPAEPSAEVALKDDSKWWMVDPTGKPHLLKAVEVKELLKSKHQDLKVCAEGDDKWVDASTVGFSIPPAPDDFKMHEQSASLADHANPKEQGLEIYPDNELMLAGVKHGIIANQQEYDRGKVIRELANKGVMP